MSQNKKNLAIAYLSLFMVVILNYGVLSNLITPNAAIYPIIIFFISFAYFLYLSINYNN